VSSSFNEGTEEPFFNFEFNWDEFIESGYVDFDSFVILLPPDGVPSIRLENVEIFAGQISEVTAQLSLLYDVFDSTSEVADKSFEETRLAQKEPHLAYVREYRALYEAMGFPLKVE
jgi:hypothetical protein